MLHSRFIQVEELGIILDCDDVNRIVESGEDCYELVCVSTKLNSLKKELVERGYTVKHAEMQTRASSTVEVSEEDSNRVSRSSFRLQSSVHIKAFLFLMTRFVLPRISRVSWSHSCESFRLQKELLPSKHVHIWSFTWDPLIVSAEYSSVKTSSFVMLNKCLKAFCWCARMCWINRIVLGVCCMFNYLSSRLIWFVQP